MAAALLTTALLIPPAFAAITVAQPRCEYAENPLGVDSPQPRLSWVLTSNDRAQRQTAYQIFVASSAEKLQAGQGDPWDSGEVASDQSIQVVYAGKALTSRQRCFWKVRVSGQDGKAVERTPASTRRYRPTNTSSSTRAPAVG